MIDTIVLLNVLLMWATPTAMFFFSLRRGLRAPLEVRVWEAWESFVSLGGVAGGPVGYFRAFFLPATVRFGPLRVRAFVLVR